VLSTAIGIIACNFFEALSRTTGNLRKQAALLGRLLAARLLLLSLVAQLLGRLASDRAALDLGLGALLSILSCALLLDLDICGVLWRGVFIRMRLKADVAGLLRHSVVIILLMIIIN